MDQELNATYVLGKKYGDRLARVSSASELEMRSG